MPSSSMAKLAALIGLDAGLIRAQRDEAAPVTEPVSGASLGWLRRNSSVYSSYPRILAGDFCRRAAPGETPKRRLNARLNAASDS